jgi:LPXTG-motif cell wall-anchored protein
MNIPNEVVAYILGILTVIVIAALVARKKKRR